MSVTDLSWRAKVKKITAKSTDVLQYFCKFASYCFENRKTNYI